MSGAGFSGIYTEGAYPEYRTVDILPNSGHLRISITPAQATVDYISSNSTAGTIKYSYTILPKNDASEYTITASAGANGSITPSGAITVAAGKQPDFHNHAVTGYHVADVLVDGDPLAPYPAILSAM